MWINLISAMQCSTAVLDLGASLAVYFSNNGLMRKIRARMGAADLRYLAALEKRQHTLLGETRLRLNRVMQQCLVLLYMFGCKSTHNCITTSILFFNFFFFYLVTLYYLNFRIFYKKISRSIEKTTPNVRFYLLFSVQSLDLCLNIYSLVCYIYSILCNIQ